MIIGACIQAANSVGQERICGDVGTSRLDLYAQGSPDHVDLMGTVGTDRITLTIDCGPLGSRHIAGRVGKHLVDLDESRNGNKTTLSGTFGGRPVDLLATLYPEGPVRISGHVGSQEATFLQHPQWDGNIASGSIGGTTIILTENEVSGRIPGLQPLEYLIASGNLSLNLPELPPALL